MSWLADTPMMVINACLAMLPRLRAQESLLAVTRVGLGTGSIEQRAAARMRSEWMRTATASSDPKAKKKPTPRELAGMGIGVRLVPKKVRS